MIAAHLAEWDSAHVELAVYGVDDTTAIATAIEAFCREQLGARALAEVRCYFLGVLFVVSVSCLVSVFGLRGLPFLSIRCSAFSMPFWP